MDFNFTSQICTNEEQSKRLLALGLKRETADCVMMYYDGWHIGEAEYFDFDKDPVEPAWSLDRLICMISDINTSEDYKIEFYTKLNRYDEAIALIQSLIHIGQFNKEYLTQHK
jgi:hypothetical protein